MAELDASTEEWKRALARARALYALAPDDAARPAALAALREALSGASSPRLRSFARLVTPDADARRVLSVLVPLERVDARTRITDADMGLTDTDAPSPAAPPLPLIVVADNLRSAFNVGGLFRTVEFFGLEALWLCGYTATPEHPQTARAALGAEQSVPWRAFADIREAVAELRRQNRRICALETSTRAQPLSDVAFEGPCALLLGSERFGLDPDVVAAADVCISIPAFGRKNSLNVVTALGIAAYHFRRAANCRL